MRLHSTGQKSSGRTFILSSAGLLLLISTCLPPAQAFSLGGSKKPSFRLPTNEKLDLDNCLADEKEPAKKQPPAKKQKAARDLDLSPLSLNESPAENKAAPAENADDGEKSKGYLNASVTTTTFVPKGPLEGNANLLAPTSVKGSKVESVNSLGGSMLDQAQSVNAAPLPLIESPAEAESKLDAERETERQQLTALWEATLTRSPDINFVLQKLLPSSDHSRVTTVLMRTLGTAMFGAMGTLSAVYPGAGTYAAQSIGYSTISQLLSMQESKNQKHARLSETEAIMLYKMIRTTADRLVEAYRDYKNQHKHVFKTNSDFEDLKNMVSAASDKSGAEQIEMLYTLRKAQRELDKEGAELNKFRQILVDLAGSEAVSKLDQNIDQEFRKLHPELFLTQTASAPTSKDDPAAVGKATAAEEIATSTAKAAATPAKKSPGKSLAVKAKGAPTSARSPQADSGLASKAPTPPTI